MLEIVHQFILIQYYLVSRKYINANKYTNAGPKWKNTIKSYDMVLGSI
jgi:hypothetical protein